MQSLSERSSQVITPALPKFTNTEIASGKGVYLRGTDGRQYLDFCSGIAVANTGHCHPHVVQAAHRQIEQLIHACVHVSWYPAYVQLAERLAGLVPELGMACFANSGAEAVEAALKLARYTSGRPGIIAFQGAFHGRTMGAASVTAKSVLRRGYEPLLPAVYHVPYPWCYRCSYGQRRETCQLECLLAVERVLKTVIDPQDTAAVLVEPIMGEGGYHVAPNEFLLGLAELCNQHNILLIFDEIQSGMGRTGKMFAWQHVPGLVPHVMTLAKGLASGFPIGAVLGQPQVLAAWKTGAHGSTFGGNPVSCAAALATIEVIEQENLLQNANEVGACLRQELESLRDEMSIIGDVRGRGLMLAIELVTPDGEPNPAALQKVISQCIDRGLLVIGCGLYSNVLRIIPPLIITREQAMEGLGILATVLRKL